MTGTRRLGAGVIAVLGSAVTALLVSGTGVAAASSPDPVIYHRPVQVVSTSQSGNWSGYNQGRIEKGKTFTSVSGTWTVPTATAHVKGEDEYSSVWVGIGGGCVDVLCNSVDSTLIQAGTGHIVHANGTKTYYSWFELIPAAETRVTLPVSPGQKFSVSIRETSTNHWSITMRNLTTGASITKTPTYHSTHATAEWIEETPTLLSNGQSRLAPLPKLTVMRMTGATVNGASAGLAVKEKIQMARGGKVLATPSNPTTANFNDCSYSSTCAGP